MALNPDRKIKKNVREGLLRRFSDSEDRSYKEELIEKMERVGLHQDAADSRATLEEEDAHYGPEDSYDPAEYYG